MVCNNNNNNNKLVIDITTKLVLHLYAKKNKFLNNRIKFTGVNVYIRTYNKCIPTAFLLLMSERARIGEVCMYIINTLYT